VAICFGFDLQDVFRLGIRSDLQDMNADDDDDDDDDPYRNVYAIYAIVIHILSPHTPFYSSVEEKALLLTAYREILKLIPKLKNMLPYQVDGDGEYLNCVVDAVSSAHISCDTMTIVIQMQEGCNAARSEAIKRIKENTIKYLAAGKTPIQVDVQQVQHKALRGLNERNIGRLLIPASELEDWDADPEG